MTGRDATPPEGPSADLRQALADVQAAAAAVMYDRAVDLTEELVRVNREAGDPTTELVALLTALRSLGPEQGLPLFAALAESGRRVLDEVSGSTDDAEERS